MHTSEPKPCQEAIGCCKNSSPTCPSLIHAIGRRQVAYGKASGGPFAGARATLRSSSHQPHHSAPTSPSLPNGTVLSPATMLDPWTELKRETLAETYR